MPPTKRFAATVRPTSTGWVARVHPLDDAIWAQRLHTRVQLVARPLDISSCYLDQVFQDVSNHSLSMDAVNNKRSQLVSAGSGACSEHASFKLCFPSSSSSFFNLSFFHFVGTCMINLRNLLEKHVKNIKVEYHLTQTIVD